MFYKISAVTARNYTPAQLVKNPPAVRETWVQSLDWEDPLEKERLPTPVFWPREFHGLYSPWGHKESDMTDFHFQDKKLITKTGNSLWVQWLGLPVFIAEGMDSIPG